MKRRSFLQIGAVGGAATTLGLSSSRSNAKASPTETHFDLTIKPCWQWLIDGTKVYSVQYFRGSEHMPELRVQEGEEITITVANEDVVDHAFLIRGIPGSYIPTVPSGHWEKRTFTAPKGGTYMYVDTVQWPLFRLLGLHGAFLVEPSDKGRTLAGAETPYSQSEQNPQMQALFDAFGTHRRFPGGPWKAGDLTRDKLWIFSQIDPSLNDSVAAGDAIDPAKIRQNFLPRYFTINGLSGFDTAHHTHDKEFDLHSGRKGRIMPSGEEGEPCLVRMLNAGLANHAVHVHGNHCFHLCTFDWKAQHIVHSNIHEQDTFLLRPLQHIDVLLPFERPADIPAGCWPPKDEPFPLRFVMHCHFELSQTAAGGNYPQGAVTHWEMTAPLKGAEDREQYHV